MHRAKEGGREVYRERVRERRGNRERDGEWEKEKKMVNFRKRIVLLHREKVFTKTDKMRYLSSFCVSFIIRVTNNFNSI